MLLCIIKQLVSPAALVMKRLGAAAELLLAVVAVAQKPRLTSACSSRVCVSTRQDLIFCFQ